MIILLKPLQSDHKPSKRYFVCFCLFCLRLFHHSFDHVLSFPGFSSLRNVCKPWVIAELYGHLTIFMVTWQSLRPSWQYDQPTILLIDVWKSWNLSTSSYYWNLSPLCRGELVSNQLLVEIDGWLHGGMIPHFRTSGLTRSPAPLCTILDIRAAVISKFEKFPAARAVIEKAPARLRN